MFSLYCSNTSKAARAIDKANTIIIFAGAGMSADSGIATFRGKNGLWNNIQSVAMSAAPTFWSAPDAAWSFYAARANEYRQTPRHEGYEILKGLTRSKDVVCVTTNVDRAFRDIPNLVELHGSMEYLQCTRPCCGETWPLPIEIPEHCPRCPHCGDVARPNVLMFGDRSFVRTSLTVQLENFQQIVAKNNGPYAILEIGAGTAIPTLRAKAMHLSRILEGTLIRINPDPDPPPAGIHLRMGAHDALKEIEAKLRS